MKWRHAKLSDDYRRKMVLAKESIDDINRSVMENGQGEKRKSSVEVPVVVVGPNTKSRILLLLPILADLLPSLFGIQQLQSLVPFMFLNE